MSSSIGIATKCVTTFLDFLHVVQTVGEYSKSEPSILQTANVINRLALFGFSATEIKKLTCISSDNHALACLKKSKFTTSYLNLLIQVFKGPKRFKEIETELQFLERAIILPIYKIRRCLNDTVELTPSSFTDIYLESMLEHKGKLQELESRINAAFKMKMVFEFGLINSAGQLHRSFYENIYARAFGHLFLKGRYDDLQEIAEAVVNSFPIPPAFHNDVVLRRYICPITLEPIRCPVEDPTAHHRQQGQNNPILYERSAIINSLMLRSLSPMTREPLTADQLIERPDIKLTIENRLRDLSSRLWQYLEASPVLQQLLQTEDKQSLNL